MATKYSNNLEYTSCFPVLVTDENNKYLGIIHIHDLITEGII